MSQVKTTSKRSRGKTSKKTMRTSTKIPKRKQPVPIRPKPISSIPHFSMATLKRLYSLILPQTGMKTLQPVLLPLPLPVKATPLYPFPEIRNLLSQPSPMKSSTYLEPSQTPAMYQCSPKCPTIPTNVSSFYDDTGVPAPACPSFDVCLKTLTYDITTGFVVSEGPEATPKTTSPMKSSTYHEPSQTPAMYQCTLKCPTIPTNVSSFYDDTGVPAPACPSFDVCLKTLTYDITTGFVVSEGTEATPKTTSPEATLLELGPINELPAYVPVVVSLILSCARDWFDVLFIYRLNQVGIVDQVLSVS